MKIKAVVFDVDGVVAKPPQKFSERYQEEFGVPVDAPDKAFFKGVFQECLTGKADLEKELERILIDWRWKGTAGELLRYWLEVCDHVDVRMVKEIERLRSKGIKCFVATNQEKNRLRYMREEMNFEKTFDKMYSSCEIGYKKPQEMFFQFVTKDLREKEGIDPEQLMFWDDDEENVLAAKKFGWQGYLYKNFEDFQSSINNNIKK